jgi:hypothetical protein
MVMIVFYPRLVMYFLDLHFRKDAADCDQDWPQRPRF